MTIPIEYLQLLVDKYLPGKSVRISYAPLRVGLNGRAFSDKKIIKINPKPSMSFQCKVGLHSYHPLLQEGDFFDGSFNVKEASKRMVELDEKMNARVANVVGVESLTRDDFIVEVTLHEIGHFLFPPREKTPKYVERAFTWARREYARERAISPFYRSKTKKKPTISDLAEQLDNRYGDEVRDKMLSYKFKMNERTHIKVTNFGLKEFIRLRKRGPFPRSLMTLQK